MRAQLPVKLLPRTAVHWAGTANDGKKMFLQILPHSGKMTHCRHFTFKKKTKSFDAYIRAGIVKRHPSLKRSSAFPRR